MIELPDTTEMNRKVIEETPKENVFYVTFGVKYRTEEHPTGMHPDGYAVIIAKDEDSARAFAWELWGAHWAFIYDYLDRETGRFKEELHPEGPIAIYQKEKLDD